MITKDLSKKQRLDAYSKAIQQIYLTGNLDQAATLRAATLHY